MTPRSIRYFRMRKALPCGCVAKIHFYARTFRNDYGMVEYTHECEKCMTILYHESYGNVLVDCFTSTNH